MEKVFGGFTHFPWKNTGGYIYKKGNSFIFSLGNDSNFVKLRHLKKTSEVQHLKDHLTSFGDSLSGFEIKGDCNIYENGFSYLGGRAFEEP